MAFWALVALQVGTAVASSLLSSRARQQVQPADIDVPDTQPGDVVPLVYGTCRVPVRVVDFTASDWRTVPIRSGPQRYLGLFGPKEITGYSYRASFVGLLCHGPVDELLDVYVDGKSVRAAGTQQQVAFNLSTNPPTVTFTPVNNSTGFANTTDATTAVTGLRSIAVFVPELLGGYGPNGNGGIEGTLLWRSGAGHGTEVTALTARHSDVPRWRPFAFLYFDDVTLGNSPTLPPLHAVVRRGQLTAAIDGTAGDANPANVLMDLLTHPERGIGLSRDVLDEQSFSDASSLFALGDDDVRMGISFTIDAATPASRVIEDVLRTIDATLHAAPDTGKLRLWPVRSGAVPFFGRSSDVSTLPQLTPDTVARVEWTPPAPASTINQVEVAFTDRTRDYQTGYVTATRHDLVAQVGEVRSQRVDFLGVSNERMARRLAERELRTLTTPLGRAICTADRSVAGLFPGGWACLSWPEYGITNRVMRVLEVDWGTLDDPRVTVTCVDDVYGQPVPEITAIVTTPPDPVLPAATQIAPRTEFASTQTASVGTVKLAVLDPQARVTAREWRTYRARQTAPSWTALGAGPGYTLTTTLAAGDGTVLEWRITWTDDAGQSQTVEDGVRFDGNIALAAPQLSIVWDTDTTATITAVAGDGYTLDSVQFAVGATPPDATAIGAGATDSSSPFTFGITVPAGAVRYVGAIATATVAGTTLTSPIARLTALRGASQSVARDVVTRTTATLAHLATETGSLALGKSGTLFKVATSAAAWVRFYTTAAARDADATRVITADPTPSTGVLLDLLTSASNLSITLSPPVIYANGDGTPGTAIYYAIQNRSGSSAAITVDTTRLLAEP